MIYSEGSYIQTINKFVIRNKLGLKLGDGD